MKNSADTKWYAVASVDEFPVNQGKRVCFSDFDVAVFNLGQEFRAVENRCPHRGGPLAEGIVAADSVFCPLHSLKVSLNTGCALNGGEGQVKCYPVQIFKNRVWIAFEEGQYTNTESENSSCKV